MLQVLRSDKLWIVAFTAPSAAHCARCAELAPVLRRLSVSLAGRVSFGVVDCEAERNLCRRFSIGKPYGTRDGEFPQLIGFPAGSFKGAAERLLPSRLESAEALRGVLDGVVRSLRLAFGVVPPWAQAAGARPAMGGEGGDRWFRIKDAASGRFYYHSTDAEQTTWESPSGWDPKGGDEQTIAYDPADAGSAGRAKAKAEAEVQAAAKEAVEGARRERAAAAKAAERAKAEAEAAAAAAAAGRPREPKGAPPSKASAGAAGGGAKPARGGGAEGWQAVEDPSSRKVYYYHAASGVSTWDPPEGWARGGVAAGAAGAGAGDKAKPAEAAYSGPTTRWVRSATSGGRVFYYVKGSDSESSWEPPPGWDARGGLEQELPGVLWEKVPDAENGNWYYYNEQTRESVWEPPRGWNARGSNEQVIRAVAWSKVLHTDSLKHFFHNKATGESVWEAPDGWDEKGGTKQLLVPGGGVSHRQRGREEL